VLRQKTAVLNGVVKMGYTKKVTFEKRFTKGNKNACRSNAEEYSKERKKKYSAKALR